MIVVVGGGGFIGQHLRQQLLHEGVAFTIVSPRFPQTFRSVPPHERFMLADTFAGPDGDTLLRRAAVLVNLAGRSVPGTFANEPWREVTERVAPVAALFGRCARANPRLKIVQISSGGTVYGRSSDQRATETTPCAPISGYGLANVMMEEALRFTGRTTGTPYCIMRLSNPAGRFQTSEAQGIVSIAARAASSGRLFPVFGDGSMVRDYVDADDVAAAIALACHDRRHPAATWNVGSGVGHSVLEIVNLVERVSGRPVRLQRMAARGIDVTRIVLDCTAIRRDLGWSARRPLDTTVASIAESLECAVSAAE